MFNGRRHHQQRGSAMFVARLANTSEPLCWPSKAWGRPWLTDWSRSNFMPARIAGRFGGRSHRSVAATAQTICRKNSPAGKGGQSENAIDLGRVTALKRGPTRRSCRLNHPERLARLGRAGVGFALYGVPTRPTRMVSSANRSAESTSAPPSSI